MANDPEEHSSDTPAVNGHRELSREEVQALIVNQGTDLEFVDDLLEKLQDPYAPWLHVPSFKARFARIKQDSPILYESKLLRAALIFLGPVKGAAWEHEIEEISRRYNTGFPIPQSGTSILETEYPPPTYFVQGMLHQGLTLLAGKMKRGKSYLALNMAIDISFGRNAFQHLGTAKTRVLYISLEDHPPLIQERLRKIQPNLASLPGLDFVYTFPELGTGALEAMQHYAEQGQYQVIILDTIGRVTPDFGAQRRQMNEYSKITHLLGPIQQWANEAHIAVVMIDHVRKAESDDIFDTVMGTSAKMGVADHGIVYQRKDYENDALLHMRGRWIGDDKIILTLVDGHLEFLGQGEQYDLSREQRQILKALEEEGLPMKIGDLMATVGLPQGQYARFKKMLQRMLREGTIDRTGHGLYCALRRADYDDSGPVAVAAARERYR